MKKKKEQTEKGNAIRDRAAEKMAGWILRLQRLWTSAMQRWFSKMSLGQQKMVLILFCLVLAAASVESLLGAFKPAKAPNKFTAGNGEVQIPMLIPKEDSPKENDSLLAQKIYAFEYYLDSLETTAEGKLEKQRLLAQHPGLLDSLRRVKEIYGIKGEGRHGAAR